MRPYSSSHDDEMDDVISELLRGQREVDTTNIQFEIMEGQVVLLGSVPDHQMRKAAEALVARAPGVERVWNLLKIKHEETIFP